MFFSNIWCDLVDSFIYNLSVILIAFLDVFYYIYYVVIVHSLAHTVLVRIAEGADVQSEVQRANDMFCVFCRPINPEKCSCVGLHIYALTTSVTLVP